MFDGLIDFLVARAGKDYSVRFRAVASVLGAMLFIVGWPALTYWCALVWNQAVFSGQISAVLGTALFVLGIPWVGWAVYWQLVRGKGTPVPVVPTKAFLSTGPYRYVRNPMIGGFFLYLLGWAAIFNRVGGFYFWFVFAIMMVLEIKLVEERELEKRFGDAYRQYKKETSFMIPRFRKP